MDRFCGMVEGRKCCILVTLLPDNKKRGNGTTALESQGSQGSAGGKKSQVGGAHGESEEGL